MLCSELGELSMSSSETAWAESLQLGLTPVYSTIDPRGHSKAAAQVLEGNFETQH
jgi:hypothetical protein